MFYRRDTNNQVALDSAVNEFMSKGVEFLCALPDYGSSSVKLNENEYFYAWWRWALEDKLVHFVFQIEQEIIFGLHYKFLSGFKITSAGKIEIMNFDELAKYD